MITEKLTMPSISSKEYDKVSTRDCKEFLEETTGISSSSWKREKKYKNKVGEVCREFWSPGKSAVIKEIGNHLVYEPINEIPLSL